MRIENSYLVKLDNGITVWLAVGKKTPAGATVIEERPMILPDDGMVLKHKVTGEISYGHWLKDTSADDWKEVEEPKEEANA